MKKFYTFENETVGDILADSNLMPSWLTKKVQDTDFNALEIQESAEEKYLVMAFPGSAEHRFLILNEIDSEDRDNCEFYIEYSANYGGVSPYLMARFTGDYSVGFDKLIIGRHNSTTIRFREYVDGSINNPNSLNLASDETINYTVEGHPSRVAFRVRFEGTHHKFKIWDATEAEPSEWTGEFEDIFVDVLAAGEVGFGSTGSNSSRNIYKIGVATGGEVAPLSAEEIEDDTPSGEITVEGVEGPEPVEGAYVVVLEADDEDFTNVTLVTVLTSGADGTWQLPEVDFDDEKVYFISVHYEDEFGNRFSDISKFTNV
jgi:hypothetical protein